MRIDRKPMSSADAPPSEISRWSGLIFWFQKQFLREIVTLKLEGFLSAEAAEESETFLSALLIAPRLPALAIDFLGSGNSEK